MTAEENIPEAEVEAAPEHKSAMVALLAVQAEAPALQKDAINPHFKNKYVSLDKLMGVVLPILNKHGLVWITRPEQPNGHAVLKYGLIHAESDTSVEGEMSLMLTKQDPQGQGSAITYARRYSLMAVLGLVANEDDDAKAATAAPSSPAGSGEKKITKTRAEGLVKAAARAGVLDKLQLAAAHVHGDDVGDCSTEAEAIGSLTKLTVDQANKVREWIDKKAQEALDQ